MDGSGRGGARRSPVRRPRSSFPNQVRARSHQAALNSRATPDREVPACGVLGLPQPSELGLVCHLLEFADQLVEGRAQDGLVPAALSPEAEHLPGCSPRSRLEARVFPQHRKGGQIDPGLVRFVGHPPEQIEAGRRPVVAGPPHPG